jgi:hypothetical protein
MDNEFGKPKKATVEQQICHLFITDNFTWWIKLDLTMQSN